MADRLVDWLTSRAEVRLTKLGMLEMLDEEGMLAAWAAGSRMSVRRRRRRYKIMLRLCWEAC